MAKTTQEESALQPELSSTTPPVEIQPSLDNKKGGWKKWIPIYLVIGVIISGGIYFFVFSKQIPDPYIGYKTSPTTEPSLTQTVPTTKSEDKPVLSAPKSGVQFDFVIKSAKAQVLGESTELKRNIPVQIFAFEDHNGNGLREPEDQGIGFMPEEIYDSPFASTPIKKLNSTANGWSSAIISVGIPYQLVVNPVPTKDYFPTTKPIIVSEKNNFAVVGFQKKTEVSFRISVFAFQDANKNSNFNYDDPNEKPLFLAPFKFYAQKADDEWELLPQSVNSTDTGWATTSPSVKYPYKVKVEAGDVNDLTPSNKEIIISNSISTLIFPYISK